jgi:hypothetical protein
MERTLNLDLLGRGLIDGRGVGRLSTFDLCLETSDLGCKCPSRSLPTG